MKNLLVRTLSGAVFLALFLTAMLWHPAAYGVIFMITVFIIMLEYLNITVGSKEKTASILAVITALLAFMLFFFHAGFGLDGKWLLILPVMVTLIATAILFCKESDAYRTTPFILTSLVYIALPFALTNLIVFTPDGGFNGRVLLAVMIIIWSSDVGAYLSGMAFGQRHGHKLFPSISPKKSWEGYFGGLFLSLAAGWCVGYFSMVDYPWYHCLILALLVKIMPGHGGLLDRFDGALLAFPVSVLYITLSGL